MLNQSISNLQNYIILTLISPPSLHNRIQDTLTSSIQQNSLALGSQLEQTGEDKGEIIEIEDSSTSDVSEHDEDGHPKNLTTEDLETLDGGRWLNDNIINNIYQKVFAKLDEELCAELPTRKRSHFFSTFFVQVMLDERNEDLSKRGTYNYKQVARWSKKVSGKDIFNLKYIFCPININNNHWTLAVIFMEEKRIQNYDSLGGEDLSKLAWLLQYVKDEYRAKKKEEMDASEWKLEGCTKNCPRQTNGAFETIIPSLS